MFNYVGWPDFDVPTRTTEFVNFIYNIRHLLFIRPPMGPIICHCSAGTGRTGAYIGIMNSLDRLINKEDLDILGLVGSLRQQRRKMVFTNTQYKFLHRVMMDIVTNDNFDLLKQSGFRKKIDVQGVVENPYVSTSESDELDELNDTKV
jgi:protein tyrosine phosphatase